jgi:TatD DNase family protein
MLTLTDTHAHLCDAAFDADREAVLARAAEAGIGAVIAVGETLTDAEKNLDLSGRHSMIKPAAGLYPTHLDRGAADVMVRFIRRHRHQLAAIGEVGLDYWKVTGVEERTRQREIFSGFIALAGELDLPLNVHSRSAGRHAVDLLVSKGAKRVQMHAFDGKIAAARPAVEAGFFFSIPPSVVRSRQKQKLLNHLPLDCLLVETDSPVLGPDPNTRNEPAHLPVALQAVSEIKGVSLETLVGVVTENTRRLYGSL